jgi:hypothetical protein
MSTRTYVLRRHFDSVESFLQEAVRTNPICSSNGHSIYWGSDPEERFGMSEPRGGWSLKNVARVVSRGWTDGADRMSESMAKLDAPASRDRRRRRVWRDHGDSIDMDRVRMGRLDSAWEATGTRVVTAPRRVRVICQIGAVGLVDADEMFWRGAAACKLAESLISAGFDVAIYGASYSKLLTTTGNPPYTLQTFAIKPYSVPFDLANVAGVTALPGFFRALLLNWRAMFAEMPIEGSISNTKEHLHVEYLDDVDAGEVAFVSHLGVNSQQAAEMWIRQSLDSLNPEGEAQAA